MTCIISCVAVRITSRSPITFFRLKCAYHSRSATARFRWKYGFDSWRSYSPVTTGPSRSSSSCRNSGVMMAARMNSRPSTRFSLDNVKK